jgi:hypothetical protein
MTREAQEDVRFDSYYLEKHELAKRKLVERLKSALAEAGKPSTRVQVLFSLWLASFDPTDQ